MQKKEKFWDTLKDIFIGTETEGDSGFVNLMGIKRAYFNEVLKKLEREVDEGTTDSLEFREELFDKLYSFFKRYFSEAGGIYFTYTPLKEQVYEKVYTNRDDVSLFWKTQMLYYVKTDVLWRNLKVKVQDKEELEWEISFDVSEMQHKQANERRLPIFDLKIYDLAEKRIELKVMYAKSGRKTKIEQISKELAKDNITLNKDAIEQAISMFLRQNEVDFFINKDSEKFLKEQFDFWLLKDYLMDVTSIFDESRLEQIKFMRVVAYKLIDFVSKFEEELKKVWNKPKAVLNSNYVITLERLMNLEGGIEFLNEILTKDEFKNQTKEWVELALIDDSFAIESLFIINVYGDREISEEWKFLSIDTGYFDEKTRDQFLRLVDNHDEELDGWVIHSENYQAMKTLGLRFKECVKVAYIDPPYNTGQDGFPYKDRFMHASWMSMMSNRLSVLKSYLSRDGVLFISIDDNEQARLKLLMENLFPMTIVLPVISNLKGNQDQYGFAGTHEYLAVGIIDPSQETIGSFPLSEEEEAEYSIQDDIGYYKRGAPLMRTGEAGGREKRPKGFYPIYISKDDEVFQERQSEQDIELWPRTRSGHDMSWRWSPSTLINRRSEVIVVRGGENVSLYKKQRLNLGDISNSKKPKSVFYKPSYSSGSGTELLKSLFGKRAFDNPKPLQLIEDIIFIGGSSDCLVLDAFAGSGTTGQAVMKLNKEDKGARKFLLIEMGDYVNEVLIPRLKKYSFSDYWRDGKPSKGLGQSLFFKYYKMEQYEDTLKRSIYKESHPLQYEEIDTVERIHSYLFLDDKKLLDCVSSETDDIKVDLKKVYSGIDIAETLANIKGKKIKRINIDGVEFADGEFITFDELKFSQVRELIWW